MPTLTPLFHLPCEGVIFSAAQEDSKEFIKDSFPLTQFNNPPLLQVFSSAGKIWAAKVLAAVRWFLWF